MSSYAGSSSPPRGVTFTLALLDVEMLKLAFKPAFMLNAFIYIHVHMHACTCTHAFTYIYGGILCWFQGIKDHSSSQNTPHTGELGYRVLLSSLCYLI